MVNEFAILQVVHVRPGVIPRWLRVNSRLRFHQGKVASTFSTPLAPGPEQANCSCTNVVPGYHKFI